MNVEILHGDCRETLKTLPEGSVNCCVTSPPYFGLRDYGHDGQIGLEESPDAFVQQMVAVFREVRRVLRDDGTLWLNLGDSYAGSGKGRNGDGSPNVDPLSKQATSVGTIVGNLVKSHAPDCKPKDLIGIPWRVAFALQSDGWYLRQDIIWHKPNPMPESVTDRCTKAHEYIFLLSKSARYFYDAEAIKEELQTAPHALGNKKLDESRNDHDQMHKVWGADGRRNRRSVWSVTTKPYAGAHFATFPPNLIRPCIIAGCPTGGTVLDPFGGSGTTGQVAMEEGRKAILCELNADYVELMRKRIDAVTPSLFGRAA
jgi:DNA modification methylase